MFITPCALSDKSTSHALQARVHHGLLTREEVHVAPDGMGGNQQAESHLITALMATWKLLSRDASHFMIMMMPAMADPIDSRLRNFLPWTIHLDGEIRAHMISRLDTSSDRRVGFTQGKAKRHTSAACNLETTPSTALHVWHGSDSSAEPGLSRPPLPSCSHPFLCKTLIIYDSWQRRPCALLELRF